MSKAVIEPGQIIAAGAELAYIRIPEPSLFADRAARFRALARGHAMGAFLKFLAQVSDAQHQALARHATVPLPDAEALARSHERAMPPLAAPSWRRDAAWQDSLSFMLAHLRDHAGSAAASVADAVSAASPAEREAMADAVLVGGGETRPESATFRPDALPLVAAALQVYWTHMVMALGPLAFTRIDVPGVCPACGSPPVASVVRVGGDSGLRYLHCSLCSTEWNLVRIKCSQCESTEGIAYQQLEGAHPAVRAETCDSCHSYLKILVQEKDPLADPVADDLATLALDVLLDEKGYARSGPNLLFVPGAETA